ncbi:azurin [Flavobacterium bizetiae]|uniref:azurin n=1 Tax=Flavobacterium bizetiae TaxID=2704140 RepID=UPI003757C542
MKKTLKIITLTILFTFTLFSCGKKEVKNPESQENPQSEQPYEEHPIETPAPTNNLHIESNDQMQYSVTELRAPVGKITLTLQHVGKMPKTAMGHNLIILKPGTDISDFTLKAVDAKDTDYIADSEKDKVIAHTKVIGGGESDTIEFTINKKGTYDFICSFPGHVSMMKGKLIVE